MSSTEAIAMRQGLPEVTAIPIGHVLALSCHATGIPQPTYYWKKDNQQHIYRATFKDGYATLFIENVQPGDSGNYECTAHNVHGSRTSVTRVSVIGKTTNETCREGGGMESIL